MLLIQLQSLIESRNQFIPAVTLSSLVRLGKSQERSRHFALQGHTFVRTWLCCKCCSLWHNSLTVHSDDREKPVRVASPALLTAEQFSALFPHDKDSWSASSIYLTCSCAPTSSGCDLGSGLTEELMVAAAHFYDNRKLWWAQQRAFEQSCGYK